MKIDLHMHTRKVVGGIEIEGDKRDVGKVDNLISILDQNNVRLASISNHNVFDLDFYNQATKNNKGIFFIPGMEVDFKIPGEEGYKQLIIYSDDVEILNELASLFKDNKWSALSFETLKSFLLSVKNQVLISPHYWKDIKRSFSSKEQVYKTFSFIDENPLIHIMLEMPNSSKVFDLEKTLNNEFHLVAYSDSLDWSKYQNDAQDLPDIDDIVITNLEEYIHFFVSSKENIFTFEKPQPRNFTFKHVKTKELSDVSLYNGLNIVFGSKGSGKTDLITSIANSNSDFFEIVTFAGTPPIKGLFNLYKVLKKTNIIPTQDARNITTIKNQMNKSFSFELLKNQKADFSMDSFKKNHVTWQKKGLSKTMQKSIAFLNKSFADQTYTTQKQNATFARIGAILQSLNEEVKNPEYKNLGSISENEVKDLRIKNVKDWIKSLNFNTYSLKAKFMHSINLTFNINDKPTLGIKAISDTMFLNISNTLNAYTSLKKQHDKIEKSKNFIKTDILGNEYSFGYKMTARTRNNETSGDDLEGIKSSESIPKAEFLNTIKDADFRKYIVDAPIKRDISIGDLYNIYFYSKMGADLKYVPSTGQIDMLKLQTFLDSNKNIIIDEFCNTLDNEYVFNVLVEKMNNYKGMILATTHNPIISAIPKVNKYLYTENIENSFNLYRSDKNIFGDLVSRNPKLNNLKTKTQLLKTIEGTKKAFSIRGRTYDIK